MKDVLTNEEIAQIKAEADKVPEMGLVMLRPNKVRRLCAQAKEANEFRPIAENFFERRKEYEDAVEDMRKTALRYLKEANKLRKQVEALKLDKN